MKNLAYNIGYDAALNGGDCIFAQNVEAMKLIDDNPVGDPNNTEIMKDFISGVNDGTDELCRKLRDED